MHKYFKISDEYDVDTYIEVDEEFYAIRSITNNHGELINTNVKVDHELYFLPEGCLSESMDYLIPVDKNKFDQIWDESIKYYANQWSKLKSQLIKGSDIYGKIAVFYPNGVIIDIGSCFNGIISRNQLNQAIKTEEQYPGMGANFKILSFLDDELLVRLEATSK